MGLDISAYQGLCLLPPSTAHDEDDANVSRIYINPDFPARAADLPNPCLFSACADSFGFRAGSYSGYNRWRDSLARFAGYPAHGEQGAAGAAFEATGGAFWELICFSDCEGAIGPSASAKLSTEFSSRRDEAAAWAHAQGSDESYFMRVYDDFARAFAMAANGGAVAFH